MSNETMVKRFKSTNVVVDCFFKQDGWFNATQVAKEFDKKPMDWLTLDQTLNLILALCAKFQSGELATLNKIKELHEELKLVKSSDVKQVKVLELVKMTKFVRIRRGSPDNGGGTWLHPKLAVHFAYWLSSEFAVWVGDQIEQILRNQANPQNRPPLTRAPYPIYWNTTLGFNQVTEEGDEGCKATRRTFDHLIKRELRFRDPRYIQELTNLVMVTFTGFTVADFRRGWGIRPGSRVRTRLFYNDHLRNATDQAEREVVDAVRVRKVTDFEVIKQMARDTAESLRLQYQTRALPLGECVPEELHLHLVSG